FEGCPADTTFLANYQKAVRTEEGHRRWLEDWVYRFKSHGGYLAAARSSRSEPSRKPKPAQVASLAASEARPGGTDHATGAERIVVAAARRLIERALDGRITTILVGTGLAADPCTMAHRWLDELGRDLVLVRGTGAIGWTPNPSDSAAEVASAVMLAGTHEA